MNHAVFRAIALGLAVALATVSSGCFGPPVAKVPDAAKLHNDKGVKALAEKNYDLAIKEFELALKLAPLYVQAQANLGLALHRRGHSDRAIRELKAAIENNPNYADSYNYLGIIYYDKKLYAESEKWFELAIDTYPAYDEAYYNWGVLLLAQRRDKEALGKFIQATRINAHHQESHVNAGWLYLKNGVLKDAEQHFELANAKTEHPKALAGLGRVYMKKERWEDAIRNFRKALKADDDIKEAKDWLAEAYRSAPNRVAKEFAKDAKKKYDELSKGSKTYEMKKLEEPLEDLKSAEAIDPKLVDVPVIRAQIFLDMQDVKGAEAQAKKALALDAHNRDARYILGVCSFLRKDYPSAERAFRKLRQEDPKAVKYHVVLGRVYYVQKEYRKAEREWREALRATSPPPTREQADQIEKNLAELMKIPTIQKANELNDAGVRLRREGDLQGAIDQFKMALALDPQFAVALSNQSLAAIDKGDLPYAKARAEDAIALDPDLAAPHNNLGIVHMLQGRAKAALAEFKKAAELDPYDPEPWFNMGVLYYTHKKYAEAEKSLETAIETNPNHARAHVALARIYRSRELLDMAETRLKLAIAADPKHAPAHVELVRLLIMRGRLDEAMAKLEEANQLEPNNPENFVAFAEISYKKGDKKSAMNAWRVAWERFTAEGAHHRALECAQEAAKLGPDEAVVHHELALSLRAVGLIPDSISEHRKAISLAPDELNYVYELGCTYEEDQDKVRAAECWKQVLLASPKNYFAMLKLASLYQEGIEGPVSRAEAVGFLETAYKLDPRPEARAVIEKALKGLKR